MEQINFLDAWFESWFDNPAADTLCIVAGKSLYDLPTMTAPGDADDDVWSWSTFDFDFVLNEGRSAAVHPFGGSHLADRCKVPRPGRLPSQKGRKLAKPPSCLILPHTPFQRIPQTAEQKKRSTAWPPAFLLCVSH